MVLVQNACCKKSPIGSKERGKNSDLKDCAGAVHLKLLVFTAEVFDQVLDHALCLDGESVASLEERDKKRISIVMV